jgi:hypothetical protein
MAARRGLRAPRPSDAEELARLLVSVAPVRRARRSEIESLFERAGEAAVLATLERHRLTALGGSRLSECDLLSDVAAARVEEAKAAGRQLGAAQQLVTLRLLATLRDAGVPALPIKGPFLAEWLYGDAGMRISRDIDLLVAPADLERARTAAAELGYQRVPLEPGVPLLHHTLVHEELPLLEIHHRIHWYESTFSAAMVARSTETGDGVRRATAADEIAALLLFCARDGFAGLRLAADVAAAWDAHADKLAADAIGAIARDHPALARSLHTAAEAAARLVGLPGERLVDPASVSRRALRLADWTYGEDIKQTVANTHFVDLLLTPRPGLRAAMRRTLLPTRPRGNRAAHAARQVRRFALAAWSRRGGRSPVPPLP